MLFDSETKLSQHFVDKDICFFTIYNSTKLFILFIEYEAYLFFIYEAARNCCAIIFNHVYSKFSFSNKDSVYRVHAKIQPIERRRETICNRILLSINLLKIKNIHCQCSKAYNFNSNFIMNSI